MKIMYHLHEQIMKYVGAEIIILVPFYKNINKVKSSNYLTDSKVFVIAILCVKMLYIFFVSLNSWLEEFCITFLSKLIFVWYLLFIIGNTSINCSFLLSWQCFTCKWVKERVFRTYSNQSVMSCVPLNFWVKVKLVTFCDLVWYACMIYIKYNITTQTIDTVWAVNLCGVTATDSDHPAGGCRDVHPRPAPCEALHSPGPAQCQTQGELLLHVGYQPSWAQHNAWLRVSFCYMSGTSLLGPSYMLGTSLLGPSYMPGTSLLVLCWNVWCDVKSWLNI